MALTAENDGRVIDLVHSYLTSDPDIAAGLVIGARRAVSPARRDVLDV